MNHRKPTTGRSAHQRGLGFHGQVKLKALPRGKTMTTIILGSPRLFTLSQAETCSTL